jgi:hypothetical protein
MINIPLEITAQDIATAASLKHKLSGQNMSQFHAGPTPASVALERVTGSHWKTVGALMLMEECAPYRLGIVPATITPLLDRFLTTGQMEPCVVNLNFDFRKRPSSSIPTVAQVVHSF